MTIKQLADELSVSKVAINNKLSELGLKDKCEKVGNRFIVPDAVADQLRESFKDRVKAEPAGQSSDVIQVLSDQLKEKDKQIESLLKQLEQLQAQNADFMKVIQQNNYLLAGAIDSDRKQNEPIADTTAETVSEEPAQKKSFFRRLFG